MGPFVIVEPDEAFNRAVAMIERPLALQGQTLVVDRTEESLHFAVRLRSAWPEQMVHDAQGVTRLVEPRQPIGMPGMLHGEGQRVVRQHSFDAIRQGG